MKLRNYLLAGSAFLISGLQAVALPISGGFATGIALCEEGYVYAWGENTNAIVSNILCLDSTIAGYESKEFYAEPQRVNTNGIIFEQVTAGSGSTFFGISDKGILYYWGSVSNKIGTLTKPTPMKCGDAAGYNEDGTPGGEYLGNVAKVTGSTEGFIALLKDGTAVLSGDCSSLLFAQDENGNTLKDIKDICAGDDLFYIIDNYRKIHKSGEIGAHENTTGIFTPVLSDKTNEPLANIRTFGAGDCCAFAVTIDGQAYGWGNGGWGYCTGTGEAQTTKTASPIVAGDYSAISGKDYLTNVKEIDGGRGYGAAVTFDGYLLYWGNNDNNGGTVGSDTVAKSLRKPIFLKYKDGSIVNDAVSISCGDNFGFVLNNKDQYFAFGLNDLGQCGVGSDSETIHYLHPMDLPCNLPIYCPSVTILGDTIIACTNGSSAITALTSSAFKNKDYTLSWKYNDEELSETSTTCDIIGEGKYQVIMTPTEKECGTKYAYIDVKPIPFAIEALDNDTIYADTANLKDVELTYKINSEEKTCIVFYKDEDCTVAIDTLMANAGENIVKIPGSAVSVVNKKASVWAKETKQTSLHSDVDFKSHGVFEKFGLMLQSANKAVLHSFKVQFKSYISTSEVSITPKLYRAVLNTPFTDMSPVSTGTTQKFTVNDTATECEVICDFKIPNDGYYVVGMEVNGSVDLILENNLKTIQNNPLLVTPVADTNNFGIEWVGLTANSYTTPNSSDYNCYYDLQFTDVETANCAIKLTTNIESDKTANKIISSDENNLDGEKHDILGRKIGDNVESGKIYIQNGKKFIIKK